MDVIYWKFEGNFDSFSLRLVDLLTQKSGGASPKLDVHKSGFQHLEMLRKLVIK